MSEDQAKRKLAAILSVDAKDYSRLMEDDEEATVRTIMAYRELMVGQVQNQNGRVVDAKGDNLLAQFSSVVDAVRCAVEIQKELGRRNEELPENRKMEFRIGVNLGDVIEDGETIYGDGVNIAARLEALAEGGGICISGTAFDHIRKRLSVGYEYLGEQAVKNIETPVRVYRVLTEAGAVGKVIGERRPKTKQLRWAAIGALAVLIIGAGALAIWNFYLRPAFQPASVERMAFSLPDKPSIAVLPFVNMSEDPNQEYLADGITENIISALSQVPKLFVIARNSTYTYKGKPVKVQKVAEELGVRYVLEGSVQRSGDSLRITAQFIDALTGHHLWSERYDRELENIFALQDEITIEIITALQVKLTTGEEARLTAKGTDDLQAYLKYLQARESFFTQTRNGNAQARRLVEEAIEQDPEFPGAYLLLGATHWMDVIYGSSKSPEESLKSAFELTKKALALDDSDATAHSLLGWLYVFIKREYDKAIAECEQAVALAPSSAMANIWMSGVLTFAGRHEEAVRYAEQALRLNPFPEGWYFRFLGYTYFGAGRYEEAIAAYKEALNRAPNDILAHIALTTAYSWANRLEEARAQATEVLRINPEFSVKQRAKTLPYKNKAELERYLDGLRKAGLPETPPLPLPDKPSIAVLPFVNMSGDPEQEYFSDGITEEIITALSKTPKLFVIARNSTFTYKGKPVKVQQVGRELGVKYVLEGSVRKAEDKVRITAQLVDAQTGNHLWAERYDRDLKDIFAVQDEITKQIITALQVKLTEGEQVRLLDRGTNNLQAYLKVVQGREYIHLSNKEDNIRARQLAEQAIALDPGYPFAYVILAWTHYLDVIYRTSKSPEQSLGRAFQLAQKALALDDSLPRPYVILGRIYLQKRQYEKAIAKLEYALTLAPNSADLHAHLGRVLSYAGRPEEAIPLCKKSLRLSPIPRGFYLYSLGGAYNMTGQYEEAIAACKKAIEIEPKNLPSHVILTASYSLSGRHEEARAEAEELMRILPTFSLDYFGKRLPYKNPADQEKILEALRKAGLK